MHGRNRGEVMTTAKLGKRLEDLERKSVYKIDTLADFSILMGRKSRGLPVPDVIEWNPEILAIFDKSRRQGKHE